MRRRRSWWSYYRRIVSTYVFRGRGPLTFWYETPEVNEQASTDSLGQYYMRFAGKADYAGPFDSGGIPQLDYRGDIGVQYNPIAIAQYGLGNYNRWRQSGSEASRAAFVRVADWLLQHLEPNTHGTLVWHHLFDWEYRDMLEAPWYSGLAQGQGVSVLVRAHQETGEAKYLDAAVSAFESLVLPVDRGGTLWSWPNGDVWIEEYIVRPPTHILNGFLWALWGVHDFWLATGDARAEDLFRKAIRSLGDRLSDYDVGYWSLYELSEKHRRMLASPYYHRLHIVQLECTSRLSGEPLFHEVADRWGDYAQRRSSRLRALVGKVIFKLTNY